MTRLESALSCSAEGVRLFAEATKYELEYKINAIVLAGCVFSFQSVDQQWCYCIICSLLIHSKGNAMDVKNNHAGREAWIILEKNLSSKEKNVWALLIVELIANLLHLSGVKEGCVMSSFNEYPELLPKIHLKKKADE